MKLNERFINVNGINFRIWEDFTSVFVTDDENEIISYTIQGDMTVNKAIGKAIAYLMYWYV